VVELAESTIAVAMASFGVVGTLAWYAPA